MKNTLYTADNLFVLTGLNNESIDLIYLDPPYNSKRTYSAPIGTKSAGSSFKDMWTWQDVNEAYLEKLIDEYPSLVRFIQSVQDTHSKAMMAYITYMTQRLIEMHRVLRATGSLYLHVDPTASHYLKVVLDRIFGKDHFQNEIIWGYRTGGVSKKRYPRKHDVILYYAKSKKATHHPLKETILYDKPFFTSENTKPNADGKYPVNVYIRDVWDNELKPVINTSKERTGYPTQKPLALLDRIIRASTNEGDIVLDPFCGCATTCVQAYRLDRKWIAIDIESKTVDVLLQRLEESLMNTDFIHTTKVPQRTDIQKVKSDKPTKEKLYKQQKRKCNGCKTDFNLYNLEVDHIIPASKGGGDYYQNYQLLCSNCNRVKGDRPMEYLRMKIKAREEELSQRLSFGD